MKCGWVGGWVVVCGWNAEHMSLLGEFPSHLWPVVKVRLGICQKWHFEFVG